MDPIHGFRSLAHPLSQIQAAEEFFAYVHSFVADEWHELYVDAPPDEEAVDAVGPSEMLDALATLGLRFEVVSPMKELEQREDIGFWQKGFQGDTLSTLIYAWAHQVMNHVRLDQRAFFSGGLLWSDLIFVPTRRVLPLRPIS